MEKVKVVVRYSDGKLIKGFTQDFFPNKKRFHLIPADDPSGGVIEVSMKDRWCCLDHNSLYVLNGNPLYFVLLMGVDL